MKTLFSVISISFLSVSIFAQNQVNLSLNLQQDKVYRLRSSSETSMNQTIMDRQQSSDNKSFHFISLKPVSVDANGINAEIHFDSIGFTNSMPPMDVSSSKPGMLSSSDASQIMNVVLFRLSKTPILVQLSNAGKVLAITNLKAINDSVLSGVDTLKSQMAGMIKTIAKNMISEESLKGMIEMSTDYLPGKMVHVGDSWSNQVKISSNGIGIIVNGNFKLKKITGNEAEIKEDFTNEPASSDPVDMGGAQITYDARGLGEVTLLVDVNTGWIIKASSKSHAQGNIGVKAQGQEFQIPTEIDINGETVSVP